MGFAATLRQVREEGSYASARAFFRALQESAGVSFEYSYYVRMEKGAVLPSPKILREILPALKPEEAGRLVLVYCQEIFPSQANLFGPKLSQVNPPKAKAPAGGARARELTLRQVNGLAASELHYQIFLVCTLSRDPFWVEDLSRFLGRAGVAEALADLQREKIVFVQEGQIRATANEIRFPAATPALKPLYEKFSTWERGFPERFSFRKLVGKFIIRRTTQASRDLVQRHQELLVDLLRNNEDARTELLDEVMFLHFSLHTGQMPG